jgi:hypothetical protein
VCPPGQFNHVVTKCTRLRESKRERVQLLLHVSRPLSTSLDLLLALSTSLDHSRALASSHELSRALSNSLDLSRSRSSSLPRCDCFQFSSSRFLAHQPIFSLPRGDVARAVQDNCPDDRTSCEGYFQQVRKAERRQGLIIKEQKLNRSGHLSRPSKYRLLRLLLKNGRSRKQQQ